jgi:hypothetical protein
MEMNKPTIVGLTAVVFIIIAGAITLKALHEDITIIITLVSVLVAPVLLAFGVKVHEGMQEIKHNTNGNNQRQTEFLQQNQLAQQESNQKFQAAMQENVLQLQKMMAEIALATMPPPPAIQAEILKDPSDHPSSVHLP